MTIRVNVNLMKWESVRNLMGETPEAFIERMNGFIEAHKKEMKNYEAQAKTEKDAHRREWLEGGVKYEQRKIKSIEREIRKAQKEMNRH